MTWWGLRNEDRSLLVYHCSWAKQIKRCDVPVPVISEATPKQKASRLLKLRSTAVSSCYTRMRNKHQVPFLVNSLLGAEDALAYPLFSFVLSRRREEGSKQMRRQSMTAQNSTFNSWRPLFPRCLDMQEILDDYEEELLRIWCDHVEAWSSSGMCTATLQLRSRRA
jgi:hypothetical protein